MTSGVTLQHVHHQPHVWYLDVAGVVLHGLDRCEGDGVGEGGEKEQPILWLGYA